jgi:putative ABC transport system ATP-binding protein
MKDRNINGICLRQVTKIFNSGRTKVAAVSDVDLTLPAGSFTVIAGSSGSGKTTLLQLIGGIERPTAGDLWVAAHHLNTLDERGLALFRRKRVGFIFQSHNLIQTLTVYENIELPLMLNGIKERKGSVMSLLDQVGLADQRDRFPKQLSGGQQQRVAVARALVHAPTMVLADEPTGNLDSATAEEVFILMATLGRQHAATILFATHDPLILQRAQRVVHMQDGRIMAA